MYTLFPQVQSTSSQEDGVGELGGMQFNCEIYNLQKPIVLYCKCIDVRWPSNFRPLQRSSLIITDVKHMCRYALLTPGTSIVQFYIPSHSAYFLHGVFLA